MSEGTFGNPTIVEFKTDILLIGGGMAYTFLYAQGLSIGNSLLEQDKVPLAKALLATAGDKIVLPVDSMVSDSVDVASGQVGQLKTVDVGSSLR